MDTESSLYSVAVHEAGHAVVSEELLGLGASYALVANGASGVCVHRPCSAEHHASIAISGVLAEDLVPGARIHWRTVPRVELAIAGLAMWFKELEADGFRELSPADRAGYRLFPCFKPCHVAYSILAANRDMLEFRARVLIVEAKKRGLVGEAEVQDFIRQSNSAIEEQERRERRANFVPQPIRGYPADAEMFTRVIISCDDLEITQAALQLWLAFAAHLRAIGGDADFVNATFLNRCVWDSTARQYQRWKKEHWPKQKEEQKQCQIA
jgi:hypothetical protein